MDDEFNGYAKSFPTALCKVDQALSGTKVQPLQLLVLRVMFLLERGRVVFDETDEARFQRSLLLKVVNEANAAIGCMRNGSLWGAYHHQRALMECYAAARHVLEKPKSTSKRIRRYAEYPRMASYAYHLAFRDEPGFKALISSAEIKACQAREADWRKLYGRDLADVKHWHSPATITDLFSNLDPADWQLYERVCHATHVSPLGSRLVAAATLPLFGLGDRVERVDNVAYGCAAYLFRTIVELDELTKTDIGERVAPYFDAVNEHVTATRLNT